MIDAPTVIDRIITMLDHQIESVTLAKRSSGDGATTSTTWLAHVGPPTSHSGSLYGGSSLVASERATIELYKQDQTVEPQPEDSVTILAGTIWTIISVLPKIDRYVFRCECLKDK